MKRLQIELTVDEQNIHFSDEKLFNAFNKALGRMITYGFRYSQKEEIKIRAGVYLNPDGSVKEILFVYDTEGHKFTVGGVPNKEGTDYTFNS
ncbi:MAG: hypothetical protein RBR32_10295 [Bacteroidales bacterium]|nr:hypothetical protein [Bacteroidales bacterium]